MPKELGESKATIHGKVIPLEQFFFLETLIHFSLSQGDRPLLRYKKIHKPVQKS